MLLPLYCASAVLLAVPSGNLATLSQLKEDLITSVNTLQTATYPRRSHVAKPVPGTCSDALSPLLEELKKSRDEYAALSNADQELCTAARDLAAPGRMLPPVCLSVLERNSALLTSLLEATHRAEAKLPRGAQAVFAKDHGETAKAVGGSAKAWPLADRYYRDLIAAADLHEEARSTGFAAAADRLARDAVPDKVDVPDFGAMGTRVDTTRLRLDALAFLAETAGRPSKAVRGVKLPAELSLVDLPDGGMQLTAPINSAAFKKRKVEAFELALDVPIKP